MADIFESPKRLIAWADKNTRDLKERTKLFFDSDPYEIISEPYPERIGWRVVKARLKKPLPEFFSEMVADILDNLRSALDQTLYAIAALDGEVVPGDIYFPFSRTEAAFPQALNGRCTRRLKALHPLIVRLKPYKGGNEVLWALNTARGKQHAFLVPAVANGFLQHVALTSGNGSIYMRQPVWDSAKNEIELFCVSGSSTFQANFRTAFHVTFGEVEGITGKDVGQTLETFLELVTTIVGEIEAESIRLGII